MDQVCLIVCSNDVLIGDQIYVQEFGYIGMGLGDRPCCYVYNLDTLVRGDPVARASAFEENGISAEYNCEYFPWFDVFQHLKDTWLDYKSDRRPKVALLGIDICQNYLDELGIETVNIFDHGAPISPELVQEDACNAHDLEFWDRCVLAKVKAYRNWYMSEC